MAAPGGGAALEEECEVVRVRVKKSEGLQPPEFRSFAVDPQITSLDVLQHILARAFDLQGKKSFSISFAARDPQGQESFVPLLSDGDLAAAFACARPALRLRLDVRPPAESPLLEDWDIISPREVAAVEPLPERRSLLAAALPFTQALLAQVGRTLARAQAALAWPEGSPPSPPLPPPPCAPLSDADLRAYLGPGGRLLRPHDLRLHVYHGGVEPGLRKVVWRYLLNVFPPGLSGQERLAHLRHKAGEYAALKEVLAARAAPAELALVAAAVRKDVVRTDRGHPYFGGPEEGHPHLAALQALLTTFALGHPRLSYCQGMSDVAAPLLAVLDDEAQAFLCFCSLMRRLGPRFRPGGRGLARAFAHLRRLLRRADPPFWAFLAARGAHDLLFCYRWLLLELKREFAFEDALRVLEITWSSLPPAPPPPPDGVPLLGAPLGPRRARRGLRERRGLRPRPPRRLRRQRQRMGAAVDGQEGSSDGSKVSLGGPEALKRFGDEQETSKSSGGVPEGLGNSRVIQSCGDEQEELQSSNIIKDGSGGSCEKLEVFGGGQACPDQKGWEISQDVHGSNRDLGEVQGDASAPRGLQEHPEASSDGGQDASALRDTGEAQEPGVSKQTHGAHHVSKKPHGDQDALEKSVQDHSASKAIGGHPYVPKDIRGDPELLHVLGDTLKEVSGNYSCSLGQGGEDPTEVDRDPKEGEDLRQVGEDPTEVPKDPSEVDGEPKEVGKGPGEVDGDPAEVGVYPIEVHEDLTDVSKDPSEVDGEPKEIGKGPSEVDGDTREVGGYPKEVHEDPIELCEAPPEVQEDPIELHEAPSVGSTPAEDPWGGAWPWEASTSSSSSSSSSSSEDEVGVEDDGAPLPPPEELGQGNPFLLFLCLAMLLEQREAVMARAGDYNEVAMHFDRLVRRHHLPRVLHRAKGLFARYLEGWGGAPPGGHGTG